MSASELPGLLARAAQLLAWLIVLWGVWLALAGEAWALALVAAGASPLAPGPRRRASPYTDRESGGEHRAEISGSRKL